MEANSKTPGLKGLMPWAAQQELEGTQDAQFIKLTEEHQTAGHAMSGHPTHSITITLAVHLQEDSAQGIIPVYVPLTRITKSPHPYLTNPLAGEPQPIGILKRVQLELSCEDTWGQLRLHSYSPEQKPEPTTDAERLYLAHLECQELLQGFLGRIEEPMQRLRNFVGKTQNDATTEGPMPDQIQWIAARNLLARLTLLCGQRPAMPVQDPDLSPFDGGDS